MTSDLDTPRGENARQKLKALGSPKEIQKRNLHKALEWLYRWGFSTPNLLSERLGRQNRSHAKRLEAQGWIRLVNIKGYPTYCTLTEKGLNEAIRHSDFLLEYKELDPYRVHLPTLHHDLVAQTETIAASRTRRFYDFRTPRMYRYNGEDAPQKIPDVVWLEEGIDNSEEAVQVYQSQTAVEVELTPKWNHHLDLSITSVIDDLQYSRFEAFIYISDSKAILSRYEESFKPGNRVKIWDARGKGKPVTTGETLTIPQWITQRLEFREVGSTEPYIDFPG